MLSETVLHLKTETRLLVEIRKIVHIGGKIIIKIKKTHIVVKLIHFPIGSETKIINGILLKTNTQFSIFTVLSTFFSLSNK